MVEYGNKHFNMFIQENGLKESILMKNPARFNLQEVKEMDEVMLQL